MKKHEATVLDIILTEDTTLGMLICKHTIEHIDIVLERNKRSTPVPLCN